MSSDETTDHSNRGAEELLRDLMEQRRKGAFASLEEGAQRTREMIADKRDGRALRD